MDISGIAKQLLASKQKALPSSEASPAQVRARGPQRYPSQTSALPCQCSLASLTVVLLQALLTAPEAERLIDQLQEFKLADVGSAKWFQQQQHVSRMNMTVSASHCRPSHGRQSSQRPVSLRAGHALPDLAPERSRGAYSLPPPCCSVHHFCRLTTMQPRTLTSS